MTAEQVWVMLRQLSKKDRVSLAMTVIAEELGVTQDTKPVAGHQLLSEGSPTNYAWVNSTDGIDFSYPLEAGSGLSDVPVETVKALMMVDERVHQLDWVIKLKREGFPVESVPVYDET